MKNSDMPAMPVSEDDAQIQDGDISCYGYTGLSKREHFAGLAMQGFLSREETNMDAESIVSASIDYADLLLDRLEEGS